MQLVFTPSKCSPSDYENRGGHSSCAERGTSRHNYFRESTLWNTSDVITSCLILTLLCSAPGKSIQSSEASVRKWLRTLSARLSKLPTQAHTVRPRCFSALQNR